MAGRSPPLRSGLGRRPSGAEPPEASQAKPLVPNAEAIGLCERFTGLVLVEREFTATATGPSWKRLAKTPVRSVAFPEDRQAHVSIDIDAMGDGWIRLVRGDSVKCTYRAGLADSYEGIPQALRHGIERLSAHIEEHGRNVEPPAAVTALWRPYRRLRLT